ncbi:Error-prone repair protein ImuA [Pollutibacter soli]|uniref:ImuA family protein n=1 Tax=Pollutibacter soli TaxID=3034157 RepID=UPI0030133B7A
MPADKAHIISKLQKEILPLQGIRHAQKNIPLNMALGEMKYAFPEDHFPLGAVHEFICDSTGDHACTTAFISVIVSHLMNKNNIAIWIGQRRTLFPPALKFYNIDPDRIIFIDLKKDKEILWAIEESLKCNSIATVIGEIPEINFTASRRLQLAVEESKVTGFIIRKNPRNLNTTACVTRWKISSLPGLIAGDMPGVGFPCWNVNLQKVRNGKPGVWQIAWAWGRFRYLTSTPEQSIPLQKKTG